MQIDQIVLVDSSLSIHLFGAEGLVAEVDDLGEVRYYHDGAGVFVEEDRPGVYCLHDIRYMDDGDSTGIEICLAESIAEAAEAVRYWQSTRNLFPLPVRREAFQGLMRAWKAARSNADDAAGAGAGAASDDAETLQQA